MTVGVVQPSRTGMFIGSSLTSLARLAATLGSTLGVRHSQV